MIEPPKHRDFKLLPHRIDWIAKHDPSRPYAKYPKHPQDLSVGFETVTFGDFAAAINWTAWWLRTHLGPNDKVFAYYGPSDLRWSVMLVAGIKIGRVMVHVSPWITSEGMTDLIEACGCSVMIYDEDQPSDAVAESPLLDINALRRCVRLLAVPSLQKCFSNDKSATAYEYSDTWDGAADRNVAIFHTPGTTESPRPIAWSNRMIAFWCSILELARRDRSVMIPDVIGKTVFTCLMPAHVQGHSFQLFMPVYFGNTIVLKHPSQSLDSETVRQIVFHAACSCIVATPGLIAELVRCRRTLAQLRFLETVITVGIGLSQECCELLRHPGLNIQNVYGENEVFPLVQPPAISQEPNSVAFHEVSGATFQPHRGNLKELVIQQDNTCKDLQGSFQDWPYYGTYATGDLFRPHPKLSNRWVYEGRKDDRIVLAQGEEIQVAGMERAIAMHPLVKSALIYGESKPRPLLVVEPWSDAMMSIKSEENKDSFLDDIWSDVEMANMKCAPVGQLCRPLTLVMNVPVVKTPQHSTDRKRTLLMLREEIDQLYTEYEKTGQTAEPEETDDSTVPKQRSRGDEIRDNLRRFHAFREANAFQW